MCLTVGVVFVLEQGLQLLQGEVLLGVFLHIHDIRRQSLFAHLTLIDLLLNRARAEEAVDEDSLLLPIPSDSTHRLGIIGRVSVRVKENQTVGPNQVQPHPTSLGGEQEHQLL